MKTRVKIVVGIGAALMLSVSTLAQQAQEKQTQPPGERGGRTMASDMSMCMMHMGGMAGMMGGCMGEMMSDQRDAGAPMPDQGRTRRGCCMKGMDMGDEMGMSSSRGTRREHSARDTGNLSIALRSQPTPPRPGENDFEVIVEERDGKAITDADVSLTFSMPAMPSMTMPEMGNTVKLVAAGNGVYRGTTNVAMVGRWDVTVTVERSGRQLGTKHLSLVAR